MRVIVQRSLNSSVSIDNKVVGSIDKGYVLLVGFTHNDDVNAVEYMIKKILNSTPQHVGVEEEEARKQMKKK